jgi:hypothetical protein
MATMDSNEEFFGVLGSLIEKWCDRRCLNALCRILGAYLAFNGLVDGWGELHIALQDVQAFARTELTADEVKDVDDLIRTADRALHTSRR